MITDPDRLAAAGLPPMEAVLHMVTADRDVAVFLKSDAAAEIAVVLPHGEQVLLQYVPENHAIDVVLPAAAAVTTWKDDDLTPSEACSRTHRKSGAVVAAEHVRRTKQLCINLDPTWLAASRGDAAPESTTARRLGAWVDLCNTHGWDSPEAAAFLAENSDDAKLQKLAGTARTLKKVLALRPGLLGGGEAPG